jgi:sugar lactone lactonase YvrE
MNTIKQISKKTIVKLALLVAIVLAVSCSQETLTDSMDPLSDDANVALKSGSSANPTTVASFDAFSGQLPESIALDRFGNIYISMSPLREIWKLNPDGSFEEVFASFNLEPGLLGINGLRFDPRGNLYVAVSSSLPDMNGVWKIRAKGEKERIPGTGSILLPNDLAVLPNGTLYITDSAMGAVWRYNHGGEAELWIQDEALEGTGAFGLGFQIGANGIVVTPGKKTALAGHSGQKQVGGVMVANTEKGQLVYIPILPDRSAGEPIIMIADPAALFGLDGITVDAKGTVYGAVNFGNKIVRISSDGSKFSEVASGTPLDFPTSLAFGTGRENNTLFIVNFGVIHFLSDPPMPGDASPALISIRIGHNKHHRFGHNKHHR